MTRRARRATLGALAVAAMGAAACASGRPAGANTPGTSLEPMRGAPGDTVRVIINHVRPDKREQFEHFLHDVLYPAMAKDAPREPASALQMRRARLLRPTVPSRDSTLAYVFIVDPVASGGSYSFPALLRRVYGETQGAEYLRLFRDALAGPQETYLVVNERW